MGKRNEPAFDTKRVVATFSDRKLRKLLEQGWEIVSDKGGALFSARVVILRRQRATKGQR